ncbi:undecaprenyl diphosphate synthase family protein, partial [Ascoidea rubescens DSM 1968]
KNFLASAIRTGPVPKHIALVMDGNRRFAKNRKLPLTDGHSAGCLSLTETLECCFKLGVKSVSIYAFSIENFNRPQKEVDTLFDLLKSKLLKITENDQFVHQSHVRIRIIGNKSLVPKDVLVDLEKIEKVTEDYATFNLNICFAYTSRDDITHSIKSVLDLYSNQQIDYQQIDENLLNDHMYFGPDIQNSDILVRTSGHTRLSDFMLWQSHQNSDIQFSNLLWPDFKFWQMFKIIFKWSYYKTLMIEDEKVLNNNNRNN